MAVSAPSLDRGLLLQRYREGRRRSRLFFDWIDSSGAYFERPIPLRHPFVFYEGHLPAFNVNTLLKLGLRRRGIHDAYEKLFERGIDPVDEAALPRGEAAWPSRSQVLAYARAADEAVEDALATADLDREDVPALVDGEAVHTILEHEL